MARAPSPATGPGCHGSAGVARRDLATYKVPKRILFAPELPKTLSGKVQRRRVLAELVPG